MINNNNKSFIINNCYVLTSVATELFNCTPVHSNILAYNFNTCIAKHVCNVFGTSEVTTIWCFNLELNEYYYYDDYYTYY